MRTQIDLVVDRSGGPVGFVAPSPPTALRSGIVLCAMNDVGHPIY